MPLRQWAHASLGMALLLPLPQPRPTASLVNVIGRSLYLFMPTMSWVVEESDPFLCQLKYIYCRLLHLLMTILFEVNRSELK